MNIDMDANTQRFLVYGAGVAHFLVLLAATLVPFVLDWRTHLQALPPFLRRMFCVYGAFIYLTVLSFGVLTFVNADALLARDVLARSFCAFVGVFWLLRLGVQFFVFDLSLLDLKPIFKLADKGLTVLFAYQVAVYGWLAAY